MLILSSQWRSEPRRVSAPLFHLSRESPFGIGGLREREGERGFQEIMRTRQNSQGTKQCREINNVES